jgi:hypothetical protein
MEFTEEEHQECAASLGLDSMPPMFTEIVLEQRKHGPAPTPVVVATCPTITREQFIMTLPETHPARIAWNKEHQQ